MGIMQTVHEIFAEITLKLENMRVRDSEKCFEGADNKILNAKLMELQLCCF